MKCKKCGNVMITSNIIFETVKDDQFYERYFCFMCDTLYDCESQSGDYVEEYLNELGEIEYK